MTTAEQAARLRYEQDLLNEAKQQGLELNPAQIDAIKQLAAEMASAEERTRALTKSQADLKQSAEEFGQKAGSVAKGFIQDLINGKSAADALKGALGRVAEMMLDSAFNSLFGGGKVEGGGIFGKIFSSVFAGIGKRESGGSVTKGQPYVVGERKAELFIPNNNGRIVPNYQTGSMADRQSGTRAASSGKRGDNTLNVNINGANGDAHVRELVRQGVSEGLGEYNQRMVQGGFGDMQSRWNAQKG